MIPRQLAPEEPGRRPSHHGKTLSPAMQAFRDAVMDTYRRDVVGKNTWNGANYVIYALADVGVTDPAKIDEAAIKRFVKSLPSSNTESTNIKLVRMCRAACKRGFKLGFLSRMPAFPDTPQPHTLNGAKKRTALSVCDIEKLWAYLQARSSSWEGDRLFALFATLALAGLRRDEAHNLLVEDVNLATRKIYVRHRQRLIWTKLPSPIPISDQLRATLTRWFVRCGSDYAFPGSKGGQWDFADAFRHLSLAGVEAGIKVRVNFESIRLFHVDHAALTLPIDERLTGKRPVVEIVTNRVFFVFGRRKDVTQDRFNVVKTLLDAGPDGLSKAQLDAVSKVPNPPVKSSWRQLLTEMRKADVDWENAVIMAGGAYGGYRIAWTDL